jgi:hypothetical protein
MQPVTAALYSILTVACYTDTAGRHTLRRLYLRRSLANHTAPRLRWAITDLSSRRPRFDLCEIRGAKCDPGRVLPTNDSIFPYYYNSETPPYSHSVYHSTNALNTIQYNTIQYSTVQYNTVQYNKYSTIQYNHKIQLMRSIKLLLILKAPVKAISV